jgi:hypothetical protein
MNSSMSISPTVAGLRSSSAWFSSPVAVIVEIHALLVAAPTVPPKHQPPLLVDADRVEPCEIASQLLEMVAGRHPQILIGRRVVERSRGQA